MKVKKTHLVLILRDKARHNGQSYIQGLNITLVAFQHYDTYKYIYICGDEMQGFLFSQVPEF